MLRTAVEDLRAGVKADDRLARREAAAAKVIMVLRELFFVENDFIDGG